MWSEAAALVRAEAQPGDLVIVAPAWESGRAHHFEPLRVEVTERPLALDLAGVKRVWLVHDGPHEGNGPAHVVGALARRFGDGDRRTVSFLSIHLFDLSKGGASDVLFDFLGRIGDAQVSVDRGAEIDECGKWLGPQGTKGTHCRWGKAAWQYVGETSGEAGGETRPCIWAHPIDGATTRIRFPSVPGGGRLTGHYAILDTGIKNKTGKMVTLNVLSGGKSLGRVYVQRQKGWHDLKLDLPPGRPEGAELVFEITTNGQHGRHFCFDARLTSADPPPTPKAAPDAAAPAPKGDGG